MVKNHARNSSKPECDNREDEDGKPAPVCDVRPFESCSINRGGDVGRWTLERFEGSGGEIADHRLGIYGAQPVCVQDLGDAVPKNVLGKLVETQLRIVVCQQGSGGISDVQLGGCVRCRVAGAS